MEEKKEFRITLPNEPGQLARLGEVLGSRGINIMTVAAIGAANPVFCFILLLGSVRKIDFPQSFSKHHKFYYTWTMSLEYYVLFYLCEKEDRKWLYPLTVTVLP